MLVVLAAAVALVVGGAGTAYAARYQDRALPGTTVAGASVSGMTRAELAEEVRERAAQVTVTLRAGETTRTLRLAELGYTVDVEATVDAVLEANDSWSSYATSLVSSRHLQPVLRRDAAADRLVAELVASPGRQGKDAGVTLAGDKKSFVVTPAAVGKTVDVAGLQDAAATAASSLTSTTATVRYVEVVPTVTTAAAQKVADQANAIVDRKVVVSDGKEERRASRRTKASWVTIPRTDGVPGAPSLDAKKVRSWVRGLAEDAKVTTITGVRNVSAAGVVVSVATQARDGAVVTNTSDVADAAVRAIEAGRNYSGAFEFDTIPAAWTERRLARGAEKLAYPATDGEKWIDVNLAKHTMTAHVGSKVVYGPIRMVNGSDEKPTVVGTFHIYLKNPLMTMRGSNADGTNYETPTSRGPRSSTAGTPSTAHRGGRPSATPGHTAASTSPCRWRSGSTTSRPSAPRSSRTSEPTTRGRGTASGIRAAAPTVSRSGRGRGRCGTRGPARPARRGRRRRG